MSEIFSQNPYKLEKIQKQSILVNELNQLTDFHTQNCAAYANILKNVPFPKKVNTLEEVPYLPVQLFKILDLYSVANEEIIKTLTSSGTTSQQVSKIFIDRETSLLQSKALISIVSSFIGKKRLPMIIIDTKNVIKDRKAFSARGAGIVGFC